MDECYTDLIDDFAVANQPDDPCPVCGAQTYSLVSGFYYCTICSTQSQVARLFVEEEEFGTLYTPFRQKLAAAERETVTPKKKTGSRATTITSWEVHNLVLKQIADRLVALGFPADVKPRILELWCSYLKKRGVINTSGDGEATIAVTRREPRQNLVTLFGAEKKQRKVAKTNRRKSEKPVEEPESDFDVSNPGTPRKQKKRHKAFQDHYAELEKRGVGVNASQTQSQSMYQLEDTDMGNLESLTVGENRAGSSKQQRKISNETLSEGLNAAKQGSCRRLSILRVEEFTVSSALQIAYAALRLAGCHVLITDVVRLHQQDAFELEKVRNTLLDEIESLDVNTFRFLNGGNDLAPIRFATGIDDLLGHIGVELQDLSIVDYIPKLMDDLKLPREFEYFSKKFLHLIPMDVLSKKTSVNRHFIDLKIFAMICVLLRLLFGFDDLTEKFQAKFAQTVNRVISEAIEVSNLNALEASEWSQLFDIEQWSKFWNVRNSFVNSCKPRKSNNYQKMEVSEGYRLARESLLETLSDESSVSTHKSTPVVSVSLPFEEICRSHLQSDFSVKDGVRNILTSDFLKKRIDFVYNPGKYVKLLEKAGYRVHVFPGTACNYDLSSFDEQNIPLFQPYKELKSNFLMENAPTNMKLLVEQFCRVTCAGFLQDGISELFEEFMNSFSDETALACLTGFVPFYE